MADYVQIDFSPIIRAINTLQNNIRDVKNMVDAVGAEVLKSKRLVTEVQGEIRAFRRQQALDSALQRALTEIVRIRQELEQRFGTQKQVREYMLGILQASDLGLITKTTISKCTEELMISAPKYWLAPCLIALAAWISNNKSLANRALKEAIKRDEEKTCLLFALITRRVNAGRIAAGKKGTNVSFMWLSRYFALLDPFKMRTSIISYIDAYANGIFGVDKDNICREHINNWMKKLEKQDTNFSEKQKQYWLSVFESYCRDYLDDERYSSLLSICPQYDNIVNYVSRINAADRKGGIRDYVVGIIDERVDKEKLINDIDRQLMNLVSNYEEDEADLREEERFLTVVKEYRGDEKRAHKSISFLNSLNKDEAVNFAKRLADSVFDKNVSISAKKTAISLMSNFIDEAFNEFITKNKDAYPTTIDFVINSGNDNQNGVNKYHWKGTTEDGENREELIASFENKLNQACAEKVSLITDDKAKKQKLAGQILTATIVFAIIPIGPVLWHKGNKQLKANDELRRTIKNNYTKEIKKYSMYINEAIDARIDANRTYKEYEDRENKEILVGKGEKN